MGTAQNAAINQAAKELSQFEITTNIITKLNTFKLTPTAKLVLLYLTTCYNPKHKEVFPKQKTIADKLGVSEVSVTRAICELHKEGLIISERKISNRYIFTSRIVQEQPTNLIDDKQQIDSKENIKLIDLHVHEQKKETNKKQTVDNNFLEFERIKILKEHANKHYKTTPQAYFNWLMKNKAAQDKIICEYKLQKKVTKKALRSIKETQSLINEYKKMSINCVTAESCGYSLKDVLEKINKKKTLCITQRSVRLR